MRKIESVGLAYARKTEAAQLIGTIEEIKRMAFQCDADKSRWAASKKGPVIYRSAYV